MGVAALATAAVAYTPPIEKRVVTGHSHCALLRLTGWQCPLCGMTRATVALLHGNLALALRLNALSVAYVVVLVAVLTSVVVRYRRGRGLAVPELSTRSTTYGLAAMLTFSVLRNVF